MSTYVDVSSGYVDANDWNAVGDTIIEVQTALLSSPGIQSANSIVGYASPNSYQYAQTWKKVVVAKSALGNFDSSFSVTFPLATGYIVYPYDIRASVIGSNAVSAHLTSYSISSGVCSCTFELDDPYNSTNSQGQYRVVAFATMVEVS